MSAKKGKRLKDLATQSSLPMEADKLVRNSWKFAQTAKNEEELRIEFEKELDPLLKVLDIPTRPRYERLSAKAKTIFHGRPDAVHGQVIIEYEAPNTFSSPRVVKHAYKQLKDYISAELQSIEAGPRSRFNHMVGIGFDGVSIFFVRYRGPKDAKVIKITDKYFICNGPYPFNSESALSFLTYLRALARVPLTAEHLAECFGPSGDIAPQAVSALADALKNWSNARVEVFFNEWNRLFGIVYGAQFNKQSQGKSQALTQLYQVSKKVNFQTLLFCVHTYFALLMKLIAAELITLYEGSLSFSFSHKITHASSEQLKAYLFDIEDGGVFARKGITNFLEGDFFRWYLEAFSSPRLEEAVRAITGGLSEFEPATTAIDPDSTRDLLKKLYQYLVPEAVRHDLGEYYTPDWLAELVLNEIRYNGDTRRRILDPACGSGTFVVLAIQKAKAYAQKQKEPAQETIKRIINNICGFDLNPLAVIAARTNYLFALGDLARRLPSLEIPVYLADSVLWPERGGQMLLRTADAVEVHTSMQTFLVPKIWVDAKGFLMKKAAPLVEKFIRNKFTPDQALKRLTKAGLVFAPHEKIVIDFYESLLELEKEGKNGIWARFLKNIFAPMIAEKFDFVVGNPPWIRWGYLAEEYRQATLPMWKDYGLFSLKGHAARLGGGEKDFSMLFTYAAADYYLAQNGKLGFLITQEVFKSKGAGEGFRKFRLGNGDSLKVLQAHDLVTVQPFEGAANKTAAIFIKKGPPTEYPVPYTVWKRKKGVGQISTGANLKEARSKLEKVKLTAQPIGGPSGAWQTISEKQKNLIRLQGENHYLARRGASTEPYGVFWLEIEQVMSNGDLLVHNLPEKGKRKILSVQERIENDLVFPAVRGRDIEKWNASPGIYILMSQNPQKSEPYSEDQIKNQWPRTYTYLTRFKDILLSRGSKVVRQFAERTAFYAMFGIGDYTVARYKVVWKRMANDLVAAVISQFKTPFGFKTIIPTDTTSLFAATNEDEAHYLCAVINSKPVRDFIRSYSAAGRGFGAPSVMSHLGLKKYNAKNQRHRQLVQISKTLHKLKNDHIIEKINILENELDELVLRLFNI